jgi:hypothetical protein
MTEPASSPARDALIAQVCALLLEGMGFTDVKFVDGKPFDRAPFYVDGYVSAAAVVDLLRPDPDNVEFVLMQVLLAAIRHTVSLPDGSDELQGEQNEWADVARVVILRKLLATPPTADDLRTAGII